MRIFPRGIGIDWACVAPILVAACLLAASAIGGLLREDAPPAAVSATRIITQRQYTDLERKLMADLELVNSEKRGLLGAKGELERRVRGLEARLPREILVVDGPKLPVDTAIIQGELDIRGGLLDVFAGVDPDSSGYARRIAEDVDIRGCDRIIFRGLHTVCDRPRFGHAYVVARAGVATRVPTSLDLPASAALLAQLELRWVPYDGSPWEVVSGVDYRGRWETSVARLGRLW